MNNEYLNKKLEFIDLREKFINELIISNDSDYLIFLEKLSKDMQFIISQNINTKVSIIFFNSKSKQDVANYNLNFNLLKNSRLELNIANLSSFDVNEKININLLDENSGVELYCATIINKEFDKKTLLNVEHKAKNTYSNIKAYYVLKDTSKGFVRCISNITKGSSGSEAHQELRLLILDENAKANSDPVLLIDENDIIASHANAIGMLDPDQVFYLLSRGLDENTAQELIINGYFEPIFSTVIDENYRILLWDVLKDMI
ncbi:SufB/SufD family protein [Spiroplasma turonicum]|uniref:FeS assembly protein SufD n=1 Tax=Spiroplasma turonicum TaxID=216946 RepID=A0A0K1P570_9MOLU|nr:SufD family Fe-S cluster assembly protein [Spiroplasma turonicum]AKU79461.1 FeS assembly protein SufD [Spiroplasma turonicum]ALX70483.1 FeS assembly protein SufD [Spiroplasma turonicum]